MAPFIKRYERPRLPVVITGLTESFSQIYICFTCRKFYKRQHECFFRRNALMYPEFEHWVEVQTMEKFP